MATASSSSSSAAAAASEEAVDRMEVDDSATTTTKETPRAESSHPLHTTDAPPAPSSHPQQSPWISIHPLSLVGMADQYTRIVTGGSPWTVTEPVVGLLLGYYTTTAELSASTGSSSTMTPATTTVTVTDAIDVPLVAAASTTATTTPIPRNDDPDNLVSSSRQQEEQEHRRRAVALHQAVFPHHVVVGWYRVISSNIHNNENVDDNDNGGVTPEDWIIAQQLAQEQQQQQNKLDPAVPPATPFLFALLRVQQEPDEKRAEPTKTKAEYDGTGLSSDSNTKEDDDSIDECLPLQLFAVDFQDDVLVGLEEKEAWSLVTAVPERIAVERVWREKKTSSSPATSASAAVFVPPVCTATATVHQSLIAVSDRLAVVERFLQSSGVSGNLDPALLRRIQGLVLHAGVLAARGSITSNSTSDMATMSNNFLDSSILEKVPSPLAVSPPPDDAIEARRAESEVAVVLQQLSNLATAVASVQEYTDKVRSAHDQNINRASSSSSSRRGVVGETFGGWTQSLGQR